MTEFDEMLKLVQKITLANEEQFTMNDCRILAKVTSSIQEFQSVVQKCILKRSKKK